MSNESGDSKTTTSSSSAAADSYIGSLISLTSKYEIRYEGILYCLNPQDSTVGLQNVRSYGTEGRKRDGPQIPPSDKVYEYILFRGSDIKDLQVKSSPTPQVEEPIHNDPAIIQSLCAVDSQPLHIAAAGTLKNPSLSKPPSDSGGSFTESSPYKEAFELNPRSHPNVLALHQYGPPFEAWGLQTAQNTNFSSSSMPMNLSGYNAARNDKAYIEHQPMPSKTNSLSTLQNFLEAYPVQASTAIALTNSTNSFAPMLSLDASNSVHSNILSPLTPAQLSAHPMSMPSSLSNISPPTPYPAVLTANQLNVPTFPSSGQNGTKIEASNISKMFPDPTALHPAQSLSYSASSIVDSIAGTLLKQSPFLITPDHLLKPIPSEISPGQILYPDHKDMGVLTSASFDSSSLITTPAAQAPLLPLQLSAGQFTEEFDFEAMNEKFNKVEVWGYLGKAKQMDKMESIEEENTVCQTAGKEKGDELLPEADSRPAYNKDEFFDTISCNSTSRKVRNGQNRFSERMKLDTETFGIFQQRTLPGYGGYGGGRGGVNRQRDPYNWGRGHNFGRGYNSGGRGRGGYTQW